MIHRFVVVVAAASLLSCAGGALPEGESGQAADALAQRMLDAVRADAWAKTGAVRFVFNGKRAHLWDKARGFDRVTEGDVTTIVDVRPAEGATKQGVAVRAGVVVEGEEGRALVEKAWKMFANDTFWANPMVKVFDAGVTRTRVVVDGRDALRATFASGGATPGDSYVFLLRDDGLPRAFRLWTRPIPKGTEITFERWQTLSTGAVVATHHVGFKGFGNVDVAFEAAGFTLQDIEPGPDPFAALVR